MLVDIDGVLSDAAHRQGFAKRRDWRGFFSAAPEDPPIESLITMVRLFAPELAVVLLTARPSWLSDATVTWLGEHDVRWDLLVIREPDDHEPSHVYKRHEVTRIRDHGFEILVALEDDLVNVRMLQAEGIRSVYIHSGYYDD